MALFTLQFPDYPTAVAAAKALQFWDEELDQLRTGGNFLDAQGVVRGWSIAYCGPRVLTPATPEQPAVLSSEVYAIVSGELPPAATAFLAPYYGYSGHVFSDARQFRLHPGIHADGQQIGEEMLHGGLRWRWNGDEWLPLQL